MRVTILRRDDIGRITPVAFVEGRMMSVTSLRDGDAFLPVKGNPSDGLVYEEAWAALPSVATTPPGHRRAVRLAPPWRHDNYRAFFAHWGHDEFVFVPFRAPTPSPDWYAGSLREVPLD